ncbi:MAG: T9SS type A sorting domain-containing protein [bacterium]|nr:T9SS type A sorting domain-containing protein [bacterium]
MKKNYKFIGLFAFIMLPFIMMGQYAANYKLTNFEQVDETHFTFDLELHNTGSVTFGLDGAQCKIDYNQAIYGSESGNIVQNDAVTFISTDLTGHYGDPGDKVAVSGNPGFIMFYTSALSNSDYRIIDSIAPGAFIKLATIKVLFIIMRTNPPPPANKNLPFEEVLHNLAFNVDMGTHKVNRVDSFQVFSGVVYKRGNILDYTGISTLTVEDLPSSTANRELAKYCFTGTGNFATTSNWNNATSSDIAGYHIAPPTSSDNVLIGGSCTLASNQTLADLTIKSTSTLTMNAGTQLSVDGTLYNENTTAGALTLKAGSGATPTASLKNSTPNIDATIECYLPAWSTTPILPLGYLPGYHLISSPVNNQAIAPNFTATPAADYDFFKWLIVPPFTGELLDTCWLNQKVAAHNMTNFTNGVGHLVSYANAGTHDFVGDMNVTDFSPAINFATGVNGPFNLIGNPYACALDGDMTTWAKANVNNVVYVMDGATGTFKTWDGSTGSLTNGHIPAMQGFWVSSITSGALLTIPASAKTHSSNNLSKTTTLENHLILNVESPNTTKDATFIYFKDGCSNGVDRNDGLLMRSWNSLNTQIYSSINGGAYVINTLDTYEAPITVNVGFEPKVDGSFTITAEDIQSFNSASSIILHDLIANTTQDLRTNPTYTFTATTTDMVNRFKVEFALAVGINNVDAATKNIFSFGNKIYINKITDKIKSISVYNMLGQRVENIQQPSSNEFTLNQESGYYTVRVVTDATVYSQKVYIK